MNLVLDIGNTRVKSGLFDGKNLLENDVFPFEQVKISQKIEQHAGPILISSVIEHDLFEIEKGNRNIIFLSEKTPIPINNRYQTPESLGKDRLANAVAI
jgi:type III pantothenate kinase